MPLYEYQCDACGHRFEEIRKFSDEPLEVCPKCGGHIQKLISAPAFTFKGTGWYITDYAKKDSVPGGKSEGGAGKPGEPGEKAGSSEKGSAGAESKDKDSTTKTDSSTKTEASSAPAASPASSEKSG